MLSMEQTWRVSGEKREAGEFVLELGSRAAYRIINTL